MGVVQESRGILSPASDKLLSETAIVCHLATAVFSPSPGTPAAPEIGGWKGRGEGPSEGSRKTRSTVNWLNLSANYDRIRDHIEHVVPGFKDYNQRVREPGGFYLPNAPRDTQEFHTDTKKAKFTVHALPHHELSAGRLLLTTIRSHDQFNTTIYGEDDRYRGIFGGRHVIFMNIDDAKSQGFTDGQWVDVTSQYMGTSRSVQKFKVVLYEIPRGCAAMYYPESNPLVPLQHVAEGSNQPASKSIVISLKRHEST